MSRKYAGGVGAGCDHFWWLVCHESTQRVRGRTAITFVGWFVKKVCRGSGGLAAISFGGSCVWRRSLLILVCQDLKLVAGE